MNPKSDLPLMDMATFYLKMGDTAKCIFYSEKAAEVNPLNLSRLENLVTFFRQLGNEPKAQYYTQLLEEQRRKLRSAE